jgi:hypothetical protein
MFTVNKLTIFLNVKLSCKGKQITNKNSIFVTAAKKNSAMNLPQKFQETSHLEDEFIFFVKVRFCSW